MLPQLNPKAVDNLGKCLFPLEEAQKLNLQALGLLMKWHSWIFHLAPLLIKSLKSGFGMDVNEVINLGLVFSVGTKDVQ